MNNRALILIIFGCLSISACIGQTDHEKNLSVSFESVVSLSYEQRQGEFLYKKYCNVCHGTEGKGDGFNSFNLTTKPRDFTDAEYLGSFSDDRIAEAIAQGGRGINKSVMMPAWENTIEDHHIKYLVAYLKTFSEVTDTTE